MGAVVAANHQCHQFSDLSSMSENEKGDSDGGTETEICIVLLEFMGRMRPLISGILLFLFTLFG